MNDDYGSILNVDYINKKNLNQELKMSFFLRTNVDLHFIRNFHSFVYFYYTFMLCFFCFELFEAFFAVYYSNIFELIFGVIIINVLFLVSTSPMPTALFVLAFEAQNIW